MYLPHHFEAPNISAMHDLITQFPFATLVTQMDGDLCVNHLPMELCKASSEKGLLMGHIARNNALWQNAADQKVLAIFHGPQGYISPAWYPGKFEHGKVVPTWNFAVVHAHDVMRVRQDPKWLKAHLDRLTLQQEISQPQPWAISDAPADFIESLLAHIVGIEIEITELVGKWKLSQNRSEHDKTAVIEGLRNSNQHALADFMARTDIE